jgi:F-box protein 28
LAREADIVETLHMRLTLLQMTFGKHIERKHVCFFAGEVSYCFNATVIRGYNCY